MTSLSGHFSLSGGRQGRVGYGGDFGHGGHMDGGQLLRLLQSDPARHAMHHLDLFSGYVLLQVTSIEDSSSAAVRLLGRLPNEVETALHRNYGRVNKLSQTEIRVKMSPVEVTELKRGEAIAINNF